MTCWVIFASRRSADTSWITSCRKASRRGARADTRRTISSNRLGYSVAKARSSSSHFTLVMPSRWASGAKISRTSRDLRSCFSLGRYRSVRMLCSRSASLMTSTRISRDIATTILRTVSASADSPYLTLSSLVTPSTSAATSSPNSPRSSVSVYGVSSTVSCSSAAQIVSVFMPSSARMVATASGWVMYGSPLRRFWSRCQ